MPGLLLCTGHVCGSIGVSEVVRVQRMNMRNMSFSLTTEQVRNRTKTVTRRLGWATAKAGDVVQPVVKGMGLKRGERVEKIGGPIRFLSVSRERLDCIKAYDVLSEGFPEMAPHEFVEMFCEHNGCEASQIVTRIEFDYLYV